MRLRTVTIVILAALGMSGVAAATSHASEWPMYGLDSRHTGDSGVSGTRELTPAWSLSLGALNNTNNSPVIGPDGTIYVTSWTKFFAVNPNGTVRCTRNLVGSAAAPAVAPDGLAVYAPDAQGLHKLNPNPTPPSTTCASVWDFSARITYSSPTIASDGSVYFGSAPSTGNSHLYGLNPNGTIKCDWDSGSAGWIESSPALGPNGEIYFHHNTLGVIALDSTCQVDWARAGVGEIWNTPSVDSGGTVYIGDTSGFYSLNPADGTDRFGWPVAVSGWMSLASASIGSGGFEVYRGDNNGTFYNFEQTGIESCSYATGTGPIASAPALAHDVLYFTKDAANANLYALRTTDCALVDTYPIGASESSPAVKSDGTVYALGSDASDNGVLYAFPPPPLPPAVADFDGDGTTDHAVWRPSNGTWYVRGGATQQWGISTDVPVPADYDGDGDDEFAVWRPESGTWYVFGEPPQQWGVSTDVPAPGDYDGDGDDDIAVWRPSNGTWYVLGGATQQWGISGDIPVPADYNGDRKTDIAVWRPSTGTWYVHGGLTEQWGIAGDIPVPGAYDFDYQVDIAVWRPEGGDWYVHGSPAFQWGIESDLPVPGDYGRNETQHAVWRPSEGNWYVAGSGPVQWGISSDKPLPPLPSVARLLYP